MAERTKVSVREHIQELRWRLLIVVGVFLLACGLGYIVRQPLTELLIQPLHQAVYYNTPQGGFEFFLRVIATLGFVVTIPVLLYQLIRFAEPAASRRLEGKFLFRLLILATLLMLCGVAFGYAVILPITLKFFAEFGTTQIKPLISADDYLNLVLGILATFALLFQLPLVIHAIDHIKPLTPRQLTRYRKHVIVGSLALAVLLPFTYDPMTQFVMALPVILLYEVSILAVRSSHRGRLRAERKAAQLRPASSVAAQPLPGVESLAQAISTPPQAIIDASLPSAHVLDLRTVS